MVSTKIAFVILAIGTCSSELRPRPAPEQFHWDWRDSQELAARESLRKAKLTNYEKGAIAAAIMGQIREEMSDFRPESSEQIRRAALDTRIRMIDLNDDGLSEVVAQAMVDCGATGNCPLWVLQKTPRGYKVLLKSYGQTFTIQKSSTNGFHDIVVSSHSSAMESGLTDYRYKDGTYHEAGGYCAEWTVTKGDETRKLKEPRITSCGSR